MVEYLLGEYDFYKVISGDVKRLTQIQTFNMNGTLNHESKIHKPVTIITINAYESKIKNVKL